MKKQRRYSTDEKEIIFHCYQNSESVSNIVKKINQINIDDKPVSYKSIHQLVSRYKFKKDQQKNINNNHNVSIIMNVTQR